MQFLIHGAVHPEVQAAFAARGHTCHAMLELSEMTDAPAEAGDDPGLLLPLLKKKQWDLVTVDSDFVRAIYDAGVTFAGVIVQILDDPEALHDQGEAVERLFKRYKRLTPRRLYTITPNRVKIRQLPGTVE